MERGSLTRRALAKVAGIGILPGSILAAAILVSASIVVAAIPDSRGNIRACYNTKTGALRVIDPTSGPNRRCRAGERALTLQQKGAAGAPGRTGAAGGPGANGTPGAAGRDGTAGANGKDGTNGVNGTNGATGSAGSAGATGATGERGATGADGNAGVQGATGATGPGFCTPGATQSPSGCSQLGACSGSQSVCNQQGTRFACNYSSNPNVEVDANGNLVANESRCDGIDNNCNGVADEGFGLGQSCGSSGGVRVCNAQQNGSVCSSP